MKEKPYYFDWDKNGIRVMIDRKTGKKTPVSEIVRSAAKEGRLITMEQAMANESKKKGEIAKTFDEILKFNDRHYPAGSPQGGQFAPKDGGGGGANIGENWEKPYKMVDGKDLTKGSAEERERIANMTIEEIMKEQGFDGKPKVASTQEEYIDALRENGNIACRGITAYDDETLYAYVDSLKNGEFYVECSGGSQYGRGMYVASSWDGTVDYDEAFSEADRYARGMIGDGSIGLVLNMTLDKSAKTVNYSDIMEQAYHEGGPFRPSNNSHSSKAKDDIGAYAAAKGYDAITVPGGYTIVLNRTKLTIFEETGDMSITDEGQLTLYGQWTEPDFVQRQLYESGEADSTNKYVKKSVAYSVNTTAKPQNEGRQMPAMTFDKILKYNHNHDELGRFASANSAGNGTAKQSAYKRLKELKDKGFGMVETPIPLIGSKKAGREAQEIWGNVKQKQRKALPVQDIKLSEVKAWQTWVMQSGVESILDGNNENASSEFPFVMKYKGELIIMDGNHRVAAALLNDEKTMKMQVYDPNQTDRTAKSFEQILKYNHNHGADGRFTTADGAGAGSMGKIRSSIKRQSDDILLDAWEKNKDDISIEGMAVNAIMETELEDRGLIRFNDDTFEYERVNAPKSQKQKSPAHPTNKDSGGKELTPEQAEYFKDSKVRDDDGNLMILYHNTDVEGIETFRTQTPSGYGGLYMSDSKDVAQGFGGGQTYQLYANLKNPLIVDAKGKAYDSIEPRPEWITDFPDWKTIDTNMIAAYARDNGYDGVIVKDVREPTGYGTDVIAFEPSQVKDVRNEKPTKDKRIAKTFTEILKFNPYHGYHGYFSSENGATSMTMHTESAAGQKAISNIKEKAKRGSGGGSYREYSSSDMKEIGDAYQDWEKSLTKEEAKSVAKYGMSSREYNDKLRTGKDIGWPAKQATEKEYEALDAALDKSKIPEDMVVYRGASSAMFKGKNPESLVGKKVTDKGYASTSTGREVAEVYAGDVVCKIKCRAGSKGAYIDNVSDTVNFGDPIDYSSADYREDPGNKEILLPRGSSFKITGVRKTTVNGKEVTEVEMEYEG